MTETGIVLVAVAASAGVAATAATAASPRKMLRMMFVIPKSLGLKAAPSMRIERLKFG
ncbi:hypothetical protein [Novosphingobium sp. Gsoil 351]|uniref:hypothetical protein n=1 Tax=Novosphingobium sp. Gsoil 351 TaxID=2675225 RepID=UPI001E47E806|nr:hypothetical protein [Novosphingobium sp. Gsoil 351]